MVYPGATHVRFEHSLGVMELAGRVYDVVTDQKSISHNEIRELVPQDDAQRTYWRRVLRMAALCHDLGHLPFSHAAEQDLLPTGWNHERLTKEIILHGTMQEVWRNMTSPLRPEDIVKLALGPQHAEDLGLDLWQTILSEIIVSDTFGVDRMDYLLRDSHHAGVPYGRFDHYRLIDCLRVLPQPPSGESDETREPALGLDAGGIHTAEALLWARYLMFSQLYFHPVRRIYDIHLKDFLCEWLPGEKFPTASEELLRITDNEVNAALLEAAVDPEKPGHDAASRIVKHNHFKRLYERHPADVKNNPEPGSAVYQKAKEEFGGENVRYDRPPPKRSETEFPVLAKDGSIVLSTELSEPLRQVPQISLEYVFVDGEILQKANRWLKDKRKDIIAPKETEE